MSEKEEKRTPSLTSKIEETLQLVSDFFVSYLRTVRKTVFTPSAYGAGAKDLLNDSRLLAPITYFVVSAIAGILLLKYSILASEAGGGTVPTVLKGIKESSEGEILLWLVPVFLVYSLLNRVTCRWSRRLLGVDAASAERLLTYTTGALCALLTFSICVNTFFDFVAERTGAVDAEDFLLVVAGILDLSALLLAAVYFVRGITSAGATRSRFKKIVFAVLVFFFQITTYVVLVCGWVFQVWLEEMDVSQPRVSFLLTGVAPTPSNESNTIRLIGAFKSDADGTVLILKDEIRVQLSEPEASDSKTNDSVKLLPVWAKRMETADGRNPFLTLQKSKWEWCTIDLPVLENEASVIHKLRSHELMCSVGFEYYYTPKWHQILVVPDLLRGFSGEGIKTDDPMWVHPAPDQ